MTPEELEKKIEEGTLRLGPEELEKRLQARGRVGTPKMQQAPWIARHPNLYGAYGAAKGVAEAIGKVGHIKYADPYEIKKLLSLPPEQQRRQLLMDTLEDVSMVAFAKASPKAPKIPKQTRQVAKEIADNADTPVNRVKNALKNAKSLRKQQEKLYTLERRKRMAKAEKAGETLTGQARFKAKTSALKGEMPKVDFEPLDIAQSDVDALFDMVNERLPNFWQQTTAGRGLAKLFGEMGGTVPQESELKLLRKVFPKDFVDTLLTKRKFMAKMKEAGYQAINVPRSIMSSFDLSAPLRQGIFLGPSHPIRFTQSFLKMFKQFGSEKAFQAAQQAIESKPTYNLMQESGLSLTEMGRALTSREEAFMSQWAEKIPLVGRGVKASSRAYIGFLNKMRADVFDDLVNKAAKAGLDPENNPTLTKAIAKFVNAGTGRGDLPGSLKNSAIMLNSLFFSPRLMSSRITLLNPYYYIKQPAFVRKEALKSLFAFTGAIGTTLGLANAAGLKVGTDPRSANFAKIMAGNTRIDIMGGFQQYIRSAAQFSTKVYISSTTGKEFTLGEGYKPMTRYDIFRRIGESKLAPVASFAVDLMKQQTMQGEPVSVPKEIGKRFVPMVMQDVYEIAEDDPDLLPLSVLGVFGVGLQTYGPRRSTTKTIKGIQGLKSGLGGL